MGKRYTHKVEYYRDKKGEHRWRIRARNGRIIADSGEGYKRRLAAHRTLERFLGAVWNHKAEFKVEAQ